MHRASFFSAQARTLRWLHALKAPRCVAAGHGEEDLNTAERGLSTTSTHSQAPEIPLSHDPSPTKGAAAAAAGPSGAGPRAPTAPFEANVAAVNQASQARAQFSAPHLLCVKRASSAAKSTQ